MLKVIIDYDDVLNDCNQAAIEKLNKEEGTRFLLSDIHKWGITRTLLDKRIEYFKDPLFMSTVPLRKGAKKFIKQLSKRYEVFIATSVHPDCAGVRVNEIIHEFPCVRPENILIGQRKDLLMADVLLDDAYHNICSSLVKYPILYKRPWNEHITGIPKIESYEEFLNTLLILDRNKRPTASLSSFFHKSMFFFLRNIPFIVLITYCESEKSCTCVSFFIFSKAFMTAITSMRLFVVLRKPPDISVNSPVLLFMITAPYPPLPPGLHSHPPSV